ncbi:MAG: flagellar basal body P-ring protein FlgI [Bacteroidota bacterium]
MVPAPEAVRRRLPEAAWTLDGTEVGVRGPWRAALTVLFAILLAVPASAQTAQTRLKDLVVPAGAAPTQLLGYGIVVGLDRTGDRARGRSGSVYTVQSIANMLQRFGIEVDPTRLASRNAAAVMVTASLDPFAGPGTLLDVTVSSLGDARSLSGGILLQTPLQDMVGGGDVFAFAQGPVLTGAVEASAAGTSTRTGPTNTGRVPSGAAVVRPSEASMPDGPVDLVLKRPDFTNAAAVAEAINADFPGSAEAVHAGLVRVEVPADAAGPAALMASLEALEVAVDVPARVVVNERTGTIVAGGGVRIAEVMVTSGSLTISTQVDPLVSQPAPLGDGETVVAAQGSVAVREGAVQSVVLPPNTDVAELAAALNDLGLSARDVVAVFQAIDRAGALQGELVVL